MAYPSWNPPSHWITWPVTKNKIGPIVSALMAEAQSNRRFGDLFFRNPLSARRAALKEMLARGQSRGELNVQALHETARSCSTHHECSSP